jgi:hypothetical protein
MRDMIMKSLLKPYIEKQILLEKEESDEEEKENIEKLMSPNQITEAQKLAREWINEHKKH